jgi:protein bicaudal D
MSDCGDYESLVNELRLEIVRIQNELDEANRQSVRAAEYGLAVLDEKNDLQQHYQNLEAMYDAVRHELKCSQDVRLSTTHNLFRKMFVVFFSMFTQIVTTTIPSATDS